MRGGWSCEPSLHKFIMRLRPIARTICPRTAAVLALRSVMSSFAKLPLLVLQSFITQPFVGHQQCPGCLIGGPTYVAPIGFLRGFRLTFFGFGFLDMGWLLFVTQRISSPDGIG